MEPTYNEEERKIVKFIENKLFDPAKKWKYYYSGDKQERWLDDIRWYKGVQWAQNRPKEKSSIFFNRLFSTIQKELPFMTDRQPKIYVQAEEPSDEPAAKILERIMETKWNERNMELKIPEAVMHAKQLGTGFLRPFWNPKLSNGLGDVDCEVVDPFEVFPFAYTKRMEFGDGVIWARWVSLGWIRQNYPKEGWRVKPGGYGDSGIPDRAKDTNRVQGDAYAQVTDTTGSQTDYLPSGGGSSIDESDFKRCLVMTVFMKDGSMKEEEKNGKKKKEAVYPLGREITICNGIVLEDKPFPFDNFPGMVELLNYIEPGEFWGESDIVQIKEGQKELNKLQAMIIDATRRGVYTTKFVQTGSGIDVDNFVVTSDAVYETKIPNPVSELIPQALPPQIFSYSQQIEQAIATTAGAVEYTPPQSGDLPSGRSLATLNEINQTRIRQKIRNLGYAIKLTGKMWLEMFLKNYTESRIMRIFNSTGNQQEYVYVFREENEQLAERMKQEIRMEVIEGSEQKDQQGQPVPGTGTPKYQYILNMAEIKGGLDLTVADSSTVSVSKVATFEQSFALFQAGVIDQEALLDAADYPNRDEIIKRMQRKQQQAMQSQMQAVQAQQQTEQQKMQVDVQKNTQDNQTKLQVEAMKQRNGMLLGGAR